MNGHAQTTIDTALQRLVAHATSAGAPQRVAEEARQVTAARFLADGVPRQIAIPRLESYFWGVVRRRALAGGAPAIARLIVAASLAAELGEAGHSPESVARVAI
jgi:hypothetical protein